MKRGVVLIALAACGSSSGGADAPMRSCSLQLSGAVTDAQTCVVPRTTWMSSSNQSGFTLNLTSGSPAVQVAIDFSGKPMVGQHYATGGSASGSVMVTNDTGMMWGASASAGMFDLSFTVATPTIVSATGTTFAVGGTLTATLPAASGTGATGTVMLSATF